MKNEPVDPETLRKAFQESWRIETSADPGGYREDNPAWGQCAVTALTTHDFFGGELIRIDLTKHNDPKIAAMQSHYFNRVRGEEVDFSASQFEDREEFKRIRNLQEGVLRERSYLLENEYTKRRYLLLRLRVAKILGGNIPLFDDEIYTRCLKLALLSNCQKGKYGCVVMKGNIIVAETQNIIMGPCKDWSTPQCIRMNIPSRTESMLGCCAHAEELALAKIRDRLCDPSQCGFYIAGFRSNGLTYVKSRYDFTCLRCAVQLYLHHAGKIFVPLKDRWGYLTAEEAISTAKQYATQAKTVDD